MAAPTFSPAVLAAYRDMAAQESPNDFLVAGFKEGTLVMDLAASGSGGMHAVVQCLLDKFEKDTAVAIFRVTAVDDRGNTVSYRTKLVHVIYIGPKMPVMARAKIGAFNKAFKDPFSVNLAIQTNDATGDLTEAAIEKSLRASGGAHQPSHYDFTNQSVPSAGSESKAKSLQVFGGGAAPAAAANSPVATTSETPPQQLPTSPRTVTIAPDTVASPTPSMSKAAVDDPRTITGAPTPKAEGIFGLFERHAAAFDTKDLDTLILDYASDCKLICTETTSGKTEILSGHDEVRAFYERLLAAVAGSDLIQEHLEEMPEEEVIVLHLSGKKGFIVDTFRVVGGKIALQTVVTSVFAEAADDWEHVKHDEEEDEDFGKPLPVYSAEEQAAEREVFVPPALGEDSEGLPLPVKSSKEHQAEREAFLPPALGEDSEGLPLPVKSAEEHQAERDAFEEPVISRGYYGFQMNELETVLKFVGTVSDINAEILSSADGVASSLSQWKPPLHWAARLKSRACVELLLESGADKTARDRFANQTAFELGVAENVPGEILSLLEPQGTTPLICVLPGRGFVASAAVQELARNSGGCRVRVVVRDEAKKAELEAQLQGNEHIHVVIGDLADYQSIFSALQGVDRVLIVPPSAPNREELADGAIKAAKAAGVGHIVLLSVFGCDRDDSVDVWTEWMRTEAAARFTDVPLTILRAVDFMENYLSLLPIIASYKTFSGNQGDGAVATICAADAGRACAVALRQGPMTHAGKTYHLTGPESLTRQDVAAILSEVLGEQVTYNDLSREEHYDMLAGYGVPDFVCKIVTDLHEAYKAGLVTDVSPDLADLIDSPTTFRDFVAQHSHLLVAASEGEEAGEEAAQ